MNEFTTEKGQDIINFLDLGIGIREKQYAISVENRFTDAPLYLLIQLIQNDFAEETTTTQQ